MWVEGSSPLKMKVADCFKILVPTYQIIQCHISEDSTVYFHHNEKVSHLSKNCYPENEGSWLLQNSSAYLWNYTVPYHRRQHCLFSPQWEALSSLKKLLHNSLFVKMEVTFWSKMSVPTYQTAQDQIFTFPKFNLWAENSADRFDQGLNSEYCKS
jgi:hypothetical protein